MYEKFKSVRLIPLEFNSSYTLKTELRTPWCLVQFLRSAYFYSKLIPQFSPCGLDSGILDNRFIAVYLYQLKQGEKNGGFSSCSLQGRCKSNGSVNKHK